MIIAPPYIKGVTERVSKQRKQYNVTTCRNITNKLKNYVCKLKYQVKQGVKKNLVYKLNCQNCEVLCSREEQQNKGEKRTEKREEKSLIC